MVLGEKDHIGEVPFSAHQNQDMYYQHDASLVSVHLDHLASGSVCGLSLLSSYSFFPPCFQFCTFLRGDPYAESGLKT